VDTVRVLMQLRDGKLARMASLLDALDRTEGALPLSSAAIVTLISQHLACKNTSRLPVLVVAAAYEAAGARLSESMLPLNSHNAADLQTGSLGDVEICLMGEDSVVTAYEMKMKRATQDDIDAAVTKDSPSAKQDSQLPVCHHGCDRPDCGRVRRDVLRENGRNRDCHSRLHRVPAALPAPVPPHPGRLPQRLSDAGFERAGFGGQPGSERGE
jgi:hypothetical protein